ncbi:hypothetical protein ACMDB5_14440 [Flavobacterium sp. W1B]
MEIKPTSLNKRETASLPINATKVILLFQSPTTSVIPFAILMKL